MADAKKSLEEITNLVAGFDAARPKIRLQDTQRIFFVDADQDEAARRMGATFWKPLERANATFVCAYIALFAIAPFTDEALARQPDRFSLKRLPLTIRNTSSFILDAFGFDRRTGRERKILYSPSPAISSNHSENREKARISDPAMAYFGANLIRMAERNVEASEKERLEHHDYLAAFFRNAGYAFPDREESEAFIDRVDQKLTSDKHSELWHNGLQAASVLETQLTADDIQAALPLRSGELFRQATTTTEEHDET